MTDTPVGYHYARLLDARGTICQDLVVPPFDEPPTVILWGNRCFLRLDEDEQQARLLYFAKQAMMVRQAILAGIYREVSSYAVPYEDDDG